MRLELMVYYYYYYIIVMSSHQKTKFKLSSLNIDIASIMFLFYSAGFSKEFLKIIYKFQKLSLR